jgi:DNA-directed RNA polymerase subunit RPC12/RpoP
MPAHPRAVGQTLLSVLAVIPAPTPNAPCDSFPHGRIPAVVLFFCTICGTQLQVIDDVAGQLVRCANCHNAVRSPLPPAPEEEIPFAELAAPLELTYIAQGARGKRYGFSLAIEQAAERLQRVENDIPTDEEGNELATCAYCGSHIASFVRTCPFCRHQLWGI